MTKILKLIPGAVLSKGMHDYSLPFPYTDNEFDDIELHMFEVFNEREKMDLLVDIIRVLKPYGKLKFSAKITIPNFIREAFICQPDGGGNITCTHKAARVLDSARDISSDYYDIGYYVTDGKLYDTGTGIVKWSYRNPRGDWLPAKEIARAWRDMLQPEFVVDCGCGRGTFIKAFDDIGVNVKGFDFSDFAVNHPCCDKKLIFRTDIKDIPLDDNISDLTLVLDLMVHLYLDEIDTALSEVLRITKKGKWVFFNIGGILEKPFFLKRGEPIPKDFECYVAAGHISYAPSKWWRNKLKEQGFILRDDVVMEFYRRIPYEYISAWNILAGKKGNE